MLTYQEQRELLVIAREAIAHALRSREFIPIVPPEGSLARPSGAFVTIRIEHQLRGCIGFIESQNPLANVVADVARKAALEDPRFVPMTLTELEHASLEVSILSSLQKIDDVEEIEVGVHGIMLELGGRRGLLLPQVAIEQKWDRYMFLESASRKAGLPESAWKDPHASIYVFSAEVVQEADVVT